jgi:hypothetical protein
MSTPTTVSTITTAVSGLKDDLLAVAAVGLGVGASIFALRKGWRLVKSFTS